MAKGETSFEIEQPIVPEVDPVMRIADGLESLLALLEARLPAAGGPLGGQEPMEDPRLRNVSVRPGGFVTCDDQYGREVWALCGSYADLRDAILAQAEGHDDIGWSRSDGEGRRHEATREYFEAGNFQP